MCSVVSLLLHCNSVHCGLTTAVTSERSLLFPEETVHLYNVVFIVIKIFPVIFNLVDSNIWFNNHRQLWKLKRRTSLLKELQLICEDTLSAYFFFVPRLPRKCK